ncbi:MAG: ADOP family duplicated permease [Candidatus Acidiferrales bacterium]
MPRRILSLFRNLLRKHTVEQALDDELRSSVEILTEEKMKEGLSRSAARREALIELGGVEQVKEEVRAIRVGSMLENLARDVRFAFRMVRKNPGFTSIATLTLALGIGANTALFSVVNGVLLNPLPYQQPDRLVALFARTPNHLRASISYPNFLDWRCDNHSFSALAAFRADDFNLTGMGDPERLSVEMVSATFFPILGVKPVMGRVFTEQEDQHGGTPVALLTEGLWKRKFGSSPDAVGKSITLNGTIYTIVGVIPASFHYENDYFSPNSEVYLPMGQWNGPGFRDRRIDMGGAVGRLRPGVTLEQANSDMTAVAAHLAEVYPDIDKDSGITLVSLKENVVGNIRSYLLVLLAAVGFVLLIACANVANLLLARSTGRAREFAIRTALGASTGRVVRQLLTESILLALAGGALGLLIAEWSTKTAIKVLPDALPRAGEIHLDGRVLLFTLGASVLAGLLFGLLPAFKSTRTKIQETLKESGRGGSGSRHRTQAIFVAAEMALAVVLLVGAGLMIRSLANLWSVDPGYDPHHAVKFNLVSAQPLGSNAPAVRAAFRQLRDAIGAVLGVQAVSLTAGSSPMTGDSDIPFWLEGEPKPSSQSEMKFSFLYVTQPDYLQAMKIPLKRGRFLAESDNENTPFVIVIDEQFAKLYFADKDPIGRHVNLGILNKTAEIVGVVGHVKQMGLDSDANSRIQAECYFAITQIPDYFLPLFDRGTGAIVRTDLSPLAAMNSISHAVEGVNSQTVVYGMQSMSDVISGSLAARRFAMVLLGAFAALAMSLSSIGIYGVLSYVVAQRTHEIGIRMALGAERTNVLRMVLGQAGKMVLLGIGIGLAAALALSRLMASMLFGVRPSDPFTLTAVSLLLAAVSLLACYIPARRAIRVDPMIALRYE